MYTGTLVSFSVYVATGHPFWFKLGVYGAGAGVVMAVVAAVPGFLDWLLGIPTSTPAKATGLLHMLLNVSALVVFAVNLLTHVGQRNDPQPSALLAIVLSGVGVVLTVGAGFFGWTLCRGTMSEFISPMNGVVWSRPEGDSCRADNVTADP